MRCDDSPALKPLHPASRRAGEAAPPAPGAMAAVFIAARRWSPPTLLGVQGLRQARCRGLADWFAVTALFRHPLGCPPATEIIRAIRTGSARRFFVPSMRISCRGGGGSRMRNIDIAGAAALLARARSKAAHPPRRRAPLPTFSKARTQRLGASSKRDCVPPQAGPSLLPCARLAITGTPRSDAYRDPCRPCARTTTEPDPRMSQARHGVLNLTGSTQARRRIVDGCAADGRIRRSGAPGRRTIEDPPQLANDLQPSPNPTVERGRRQAANILSPVADTLFKGARAITAPPNPDAAMAVKLG